MSEAFKVSLTWSASVTIAPPWKPWGRNAISGYISTPRQRMLCARTGHPRGASATLYRRGEWFRMCCRCGHREAA